MIYGRSDNWNDEQREAYRILYAAYNQLSILTYDHLLMREKNVLGAIDDYMDEEDGDAELLSGKKTAYAEYRKLRDEAQELAIAESNLSSLFEMDQAEEQHLQKEKEH